MEYLDLNGVRLCAGEIALELNSLLSIRAVVGKPKAKQWRFFRTAVLHLLGNEGAEDFIDLSDVEAAQLKFEVEDRLSVNDRPHGAIR